MIVKIIKPFRQFFECNNFNFTLYTCWGIIFFDHFFDKIRQTFSVGFNYSKFFTETFK